jgi:hypothetical protein
MARDERRPCEFCNKVSCYGIVDRGDGRGGFSLASKELREYAEGMRRLSSTADAAN